jgi:flagellar biosynthesis GTPase FlhF
LVIFTLRKALNISSFKDNQKEAYLAFNMMVCTSTKEYLILNTTSKEFTFDTTI